MTLVSIPHTFVSSSFLNIKFRLNREKEIEKRKPRCYAFFAL